MNQRENVQLQPILSLRFSVVWVSALVLLAACGRAPSTLLRVGQAPVYDFPLYVSSGDGTGTIWKYEIDGSKTVFVTGLNDPRGVATDKFNHLYVVEAGASRLVRFDLKSSQMTVVRDGLQTPSVVAADSFGESYVTQEGAKNIIRASDGKVVASFGSRPTALAFGVNDLLLVGLYDASQVVWGIVSGAPAATVSEPVMIATDSTGRVYVAQGSASGAKVFRYNQRDNGGLVTVADGLNGATGIAVDPAGNIYIAEPGASRLVLVTFDGQLYNWSSVSVPQYLTFTQY